MDKSHTSFGHYSLFEKCNKTVSFTSAEKQKSIKDNRAYLPENCSEFLMIFPERRDALQGWSTNVTGGVINLNVAAWPMTLQYEGFMRFNYIDL